MRLCSDPIQKGLLEFAQLQKKVLGFADDGRVPTCAADHADELLRVQRPATVVALVSPGVVESAVGTLTLDVTVRQEAAVGFAVGLARGVLIDVPLLQQLEEDALGNLGMVIGMGSSEEVEAYAQALPVIQEFGLVLVRDFLSGDASLLRGQRDGRAVSVASRHHENLIALHSVVSGKDVGWKVNSGDVAEMNRAVGVRPCNCNKDSLRHKSTGPICSGFDCTCYHRRYFSEEYSGL